MAASAGPAACCCGPGRPSSAQTRGRAGCSGTPPCRGCTAPSRRPRASGTAVAGPGSAAGTAGVRPGEHEKPRVGEARSARGPAHVLGVVVEVLPNLAHLAADPAKVQVRVLPLDLGAGVLAPEHEGRDGLLRGVVVLELADLLAPAAVRGGALVGLRHGRWWLRGTRPEVAAAGRTRRRGNPGQDG